MFGVGGLFGISALDYINYWRNNCVLLTIYTERFQDNDRKNSLGESGAERVLKDLNSGEPKFYGDWIISYSNFFTMVYLQQEFNR